MKTILTQAEHEKLSEEMQKLFKKRSTGDYLISLDEVNGVRVTDDSSVRKALEEERETVKALTKVSKIFEGRDEAWLVKAEKALARKPIKDTDVQKQIEAAVNEFKVESEAASKATREVGDARLAKREKQIRSLLLSNDAVLAMGEEGTKVIRQKALLPVVLGQMGTQDNAEGDIETFVMNDEGKPKITRLEGKTGHMGVRELLASMKLNSEYSWAFEGVQAQGSGEGGSQGGGGSNANHVLSNEDAQDPVKYRAAKAEAEKDGMSVRIASA